MAPDAMAIIGEPLVLVTGVVAKRKVTVSASGKTTVDAATPLTLKSAACTEPPEYGFVKFTTNSVARAVTVAPAAGVVLATAKPRRLSVLNALRRPPVATFPVSVDTRSAPPSSALRTP